MKLNIINNDLQNIAKTQSLLKIKNKYISEKINKISTFIDDISEQITILDETISSLESYKDNFEKGKKYYYEICPILEKIRSTIDEYETIADINIYNIPTYSDMLFKKL